MAKLPGPTSTNDFAARSKRIRGASTSAAGGGLSERGFQKASRWRLNMMMIHVQFNVWSETKEKTDKRQPGEGQCGVNTGKSKRHRQQ